VGAQDVFLYEFELLGVKLLSKFGIVKWRFGSFMAFFNCVWLFTAILLAVFGLLLKVWPFLKK